jgi:hypothetical protein
MHACSERETNSEDFGARITEIESTVEKIWLFEVLGTYLKFWKVSRENFVMP